jgi:hypothetical protein
VADIADARLELDDAELEPRRRQLLSRAAFRRNSSLAPPVFIEFPVR